MFWLKTIRACQNKKEEADFMNLKALIGLAIATTLITGCTVVQHPDGSISSMIGKAASKSTDKELKQPKPAGSSGAESNTFDKNEFNDNRDHREVQDNRQLHINSHNSAEPATGSPPVSSTHRAIESLLGGLDSTVFVPSRYIQETTESTAIKVGASQFALTKGCLFMQRYRIAINADFTGSLNLMKYRAYGMGSEWITVQFHAESTPYERLRDYGASLFLVDGTKTIENQVFTVMEADLFDCG